MRSVLEQTRKPDIYFHANGKIDITSSITRTLGIEAGDVIDISVYGGEYYIYVRHKAATLIGKHKAICRPANKGNHFMRCYCRQLTSFINDVCGARESHLYVGEKTDIAGLGIALPLITRNNLYNEKEY